MSDRLHSPSTSGTSSSSPDPSHTSDEAERRASTATAPSRPNKKLPRHQCQLCEKLYDRQDHLNRHLRSHENTRPFQCSSCQKGFNRLDLLNRHVLGHERKIAHPRNKSKPKERTSQACKGCVASKTKCEDKKPCSRCQTRKTQCVPPNPPTGDEMPSRGAYPQSPEPTTGSSPSTARSQQRLSHSDIQSMSCSNATETPGSSDPISFQYNLMAEFDFQPQSFPEFFDQIMMPQVPGLISGNDLVVPPDVSSFGQEMDFSLDNFDFQLLEPFPSDVLATGDTSSPSSSRSTLSLRADAFELSPWAYNPPRNHDSLSIQQDISIDESHIPQDTGMQTSGRKRLLSDLLDASSRDKIFRMVLHICSRKQAVPSFPSQTLLAKFVEIFYSQEAQSLEARVQPSTYQLADTRPELLLAFVAAGAVAINSEPIQKMGIAFQEIVRLAVGELFERDNSMTRDLQALQAYLLWLDIGLWSGYKRSMEVAGSFLQPLFTLLIKANAFARSNHLYVELRSSDPTELVETLWQDWRKKESLKRLAIQAFLHDSRASLALLRNPLISSARMSIALLGPRNLWLAPDAQTWANMLITGAASISSQPQMLLGVFANIDILKGLKSQVDVYLSFLSALHAIAGQVWDYKQHSGFRNSRERMSDETDLLNTARQKNLYKTLTKLRFRCDSFGQGAPETKLLAEFLMMFLNVSLEDVQRFAGKDGEREARDVVSAMREWCNSKEARAAVWHAGQVLRNAKSFRRTKLGGFHAVAVYFSALTLWVYCLITSIAARQSGLETPTENNSLQGQRRELEAFGPSCVLVESTNVILDGVDAPLVRSFIMFNQGQPGLGAVEKKFHTDDLREIPFCDLRHAKGVMLNAAAIIQGNYLQTASPPPMVRNLLDLMLKLGELSGKSTEASVTDSWETTIESGVDMETLDR